MSLVEKSSNKLFGGCQKVFSHQSEATQTTMTFGIYLPPQAESSKVPVVYYLSGLTCTEQNVVTKAGAQRVCARLGLALVCPDTSPRGANIPGEDDAYDFGSGAGFYVDATEPAWKKNYNMYTYVTHELPALVASNFNVDKTRQSITGHSMGGHGALMIYLKNAGLFKAVSAFAPICNPTECDWGKKAFGGYLGDNKEAWKAYDSTELMKEYDGPKTPILIDQGAADNFYPHQLLPENFAKVCQNKGLPLTLRLQEGYDHSYYFIATFMEEHLEHHAKYLQ